MYSDYAVEYDATSGLYRVVGIKEDGKRVVLRHDFQSQLQAQAHIDNLEAA